LRREILQQRDIFVGERPHFSAVDSDDAEQLAVVAQRYCKLRPDTTVLEEFAVNGFVRPLIRKLSHIGYMQ